MRGRAEGESGRLRARARRVPPSHPPTPHLPSSPPLRAGFPGADAEFDTACAWLAAAPAVAGSRGPLLDLSCGSGLFSRRFAASPLFDGVIAADYSESMLRTAAAGLAADGVAPGRYLPLRVDAGRLPFANASLAAVHAGAALHCWPAPGLALTPSTPPLRRVATAAAFPSSPVPQSAAAEALPLSLRQSWERRATALL